MELRGKAGPLLAGTVLLGVGSLVAGCQNGKAALDGSAPPAREKVTQSELLAFCPPVGLRQGTAFFTSYEKAAPVRRPKKIAQPADAPDADPTADEATDKPAQRVVYQTSITDVTRSCARDGGTLTMKVGVAGKIVPGAAAKAGSVRLPIRIALTTGDQVLFSRLYTQEVQVTDLSTATQFTFTVDDVRFPDPNTRAVRGYAGFDEGPPAKDDASTGSDLPPD